jgi:hypothetical protein
MGGRCAFGRENEDGSVSYTLVADLGPWDFESPPLSDLEHRAPSVAAYFSDERNEDEDCINRLLYRLDGTGVCRMWGGTHELIWRRITSDC